MTEQADHYLLELTADIVSAFVSNNQVRSNELPEIIAAVHSSIQNIGKPQEEAAPAPVLTPAVSIKKSVTEDYLVCLDDGKKFKSLRRHLAILGMTPDDYRAKWGLARDYPMVAPGYAAKRSDLAKASGLGNSRRLTSSSDAAELTASPANDADEPMDEPVVQTSAAKMEKSADETMEEPVVAEASAKRRGRPKKAA